MMATDYLYRVYFLTKNHSMHDDYGGDEDDGVHDDDGVHVADEFHLAQRCSGKRHYSLKNNRFVYVRNSNKITKVFSLKLRVKTKTIRFCQFKQ